MQHNRLLAIRIVQHKFNLKISVLLPLDCGDSSLGPLSERDRWRCPLTVAKDWVLLTRPYNSSTELWRLGLAWDPKHRTYFLYYNFDICSNLSEPPHHLCYSIIPVSTDANLSLQMFVSLIYVLKDFTERIDTNTQDPIVDSK